MGVKIRDLKDVSAVQAFKSVRADITVFSMQAYITTAEKYKAICNFRALCHKVRENEKCENKIKKIVQKSGIEWDDDNIELSIHKALCSKIPEEMQKSLSFKRYLYNTPRIVRLIDNKNVPLCKTYEYLQKYGIDELANNRVSKNDSFSIVDSSQLNKVDSQTRASLEDIKQNCNILIKVIRNFLN